MSKSTIITAAILLLFCIPAAKSSSIVYASSAEVAISADPPQVSDVKGVVRDAHGEPLIGVTVSLRGDSKTGTITDTNGAYTLTCSPDAVLRFSYIGFETVEVPRAGKQRLDVILRESSEQLEEVIVVGYGTTTRKSAVGAVSQVKADVFENQPTANVAQALQGAAPGVIIQQTGQNPNDRRLNLNIRGVSTLNNNDPLIVIDGLVSSVDIFQKLNPADIQSLTVLKDAGSAAIYGSRSANGVIVVTTKSGRRGEKPTLSFSAGVGVNSPQILFRPVKGWQNATLANLANTNVGQRPKFSPAEIRDLADHEAEESWFYDQIFKDALQQNYNVRFSGDTEASTYMVSVGYFDQRSNYAGNSSLGAQRYNIRTNVSTTIDKLKLTGILSYTRNNSRSTTGSSLEIDAARTPPYYYYKMKSEDGRYLINDVLSEFNPLGQLEASGFNKFRNNYVNAGITGDWTLPLGFSLKGVLGVDITNDNRFTRHYAVPYYASEEATEPRPMNRAQYYTSTWNSDVYMINSQLLLNYDRDFGEHHVSGLVGATNESYTASYNSIHKGYVDPTLGTPTDETTKAGNITGETPVESSVRTSITSLLGRLGYNFGERYYGEFNFRYDASSKFDRRYRGGFFPSLSLGWRISEEPFMQIYKQKVGDLKLRSSYGILGSQAIGPYDRFTVYTVYNNGYVYNNQSVSTTGFALGLDDLSWEKTRTFNLGLDGTLIHGSLQYTLDVFSKYTYDILMKPLVPSIFGTGMPMDNIGAMSNVGWEIGLDYRFDTGDLHHSINLNIGDGFNKVVTFEGYERIQQVDEMSKIIREGVPLNSYYGYKTDGLFQSYEEIETSALPVGARVQPGDLKFVDRNDDGIIDSKDRFVLGNAFPRYTFGATYGLQWRGFDFSMFWQGVGKRDMMLRGELIEPFHQNYSHVIFRHQLDFWTPTHTDAKYPRLTAAGSDSNKNNYRTGSDLLILDGKYIRLKNLVIGYRLPSSWTSKLGIGALRVYLTGQNLLTFSPNSFIAPESTEFNSQMSSGGANSGRSYPTLRYYGFGIDLNI